MQRKIRDLSVGLGQFREYGADYIYPVFVPCNIVALAGFARKWVIFSEGCETKASNHWF